jgi:hypothetical protein
MNVEKRSTLGGASTNVNRSVYDQIEEESRKQGKFVKLQAGEKIVLQFVTEPLNEKIRIVDRVYTDEKTGKTSKSKRVQYTVLDPRMAADDSSNSQEKVFELAIRFAGQLNALLKKGMKLIEVERRGSGTATSYLFVPL